jgi:hypothetical protein
MSTAVEGGRLPPSRNVAIAKAESDNRERSLHWSQSQPSSIASSSGATNSKATLVSDTPKVANRGAENQSASQQNNSIINRDDLINSNPIAAANGSHSIHGSGSVAGGKSNSSREKSSESTSKGWDDDQSNTASGDGKKHARRRKANRACSHCQKAHLTCDDCE